MGQFIDLYDSSEGLICPKCGSDNIIILSTDGGTFLCQDCAHIFGHQDEIFEDYEDNYKD